MITTKHKTGEGFSASAVIAGRSFTADGTTRAKAWHQLIELVADVFKKAA